MDFASGLTRALGGRYEIEREIGRGGMAIVYVARDARHDRPLAVKVLRPELGTSLAAERFLREIQIAAQLQHPLIVPLYDSGATDDNLLWFVMPFIEGETLRARLVREKQLPLGEALRIARETTEALSYAHAHGVVHRDIKPENILLTSEHAVITDFGIARAISEAGGGGLTSAGVSVGTPAYMSPEQAAGSAVDGRSDVYGLGCVLFEMLAGEPPFTGPTPQAVLARHISENVPSLRVVRPNVPGPVERVVATALAKVPADRFGTAQEFRSALDSLELGREPGLAAQRRIRGWPTLVGLSVAVLFALLVWRGVVAPPPRLDPGHVVVYPLATSSGAEHAAPFGEDVATALLTALNAAEHLEVADGWRLLDERQRENPRRVTEGDVWRISRQAGAQFAVDGWVLFSDSTRVGIRLHDLAGDSGSVIVIAFAASADPWTVGLRAASALLPRLIPAGASVDLSALSDRSLTATARFLRGEQAYRRARFAEAFDYYRNAVAADSAFALAAVRGAQAASWNRQEQEARDLIRTALAHDRFLAPRDRHLALGFEAYLLGDADTAAGRLRQAVAVDPRWPEAWMALGEVYTHLLPGDGPLDSLAAAAFDEVHRLDSTFAPVLYHLIEIALRRGDVRGATRLLRQFRQGEPDSAELVPSELMLRCVAESPNAVNWRELARTIPQWVVEAGRALAVAGLRQPRCAEPAWRAVIAADTASDVMGRARRQGALSGLQALLVAGGRTEQLRQLLDSDTASAPGYTARLYVLSALAGAALEREADDGAAELRRAYEANPAGTMSVQLWHLGSWEAHRGRWAEAKAIADTLAARATRSRERREARMASSVLARALLARGDSTEALRLLVALVPDTVRGALTWQPWESLGGERLLLAQLRFARGEFAESYRIAAGFDAPTSVPYVMYLPASLALRMRAAEAMGDARAAEAMRRRLVVLGRRDLVELL
ncbi:MAG: protein kinase [Gemmatimonadetes bacterium]|nr:protein kinase [Gemmatimonadota bacterium]